MSALRQTIERAAAAPFAVLIEGESGSGKELVARAIHRGSARRHKPFCTLNCAALPDDLVEAELFGHTRGAFTGAVAERAGVFEEAHGGTLFLDEIGELTPRAQAKVLRVIQDGELRRVGENVSRRVDVRIVAATNRALAREVEAGRFRLDLLYRLDVVHITVPPLRERREDIAVLAEHFWRDATDRVGSRATLGAATLAALARYDWPGNVRELQNVLAALAVRTPKRGVVPPSALPPCFAERGPADSRSLDEARRTFEHRFVRAALVRTGGHRGRAAAELGVTRQGLTKLMTPPRNSELTNSEFSEFIGRGGRGGGAPGSSDLARGRARSWPAPPLERPRGSARRRATPAGARRSGSRRRPWSASGPRSPDRSAAATATRSAPRAARSRRRSRSARRTESAPVAPARGDSASRRSSRTARTPADRPGSAAVACCSACSAPSTSPSCSSARP